MRMAIGALALAACASAPETRPSWTRGCVQVVHRRKTTPAYWLAGQPIGERELLDELAHDGSSSHEGREAREHLKGATVTRWTGVGMFFAGMLTAFVSDGGHQQVGAAIGVASAGIALAMVSLPVDLVGRDHLRRSVEQYNQAAQCR